MVIVNIFPVLQVIYVPVGCMDLEVYENGLQWHLRYI